MIQDKLVSLLLLLTVAGSCDKGSNGGVAQPDPKISIEDVALFEGNNGTTGFEFVVSLDVASAKTVQVAYSTLNGTAKSGEDFTAATNQVISFAPSEKSKKVVVAVTGDAQKEPEETFTVVLSNPVNATIQKATATAYIKNDDEGGRFPSLVWSDEFNGTALDGSAWTFETGDGCPNLCGWGNNELEYYTDRAENLFFRDGAMVIEARRESMGTRNYTSAKIVSRGKKVIRYGRLEIRAKLPAGKGIWPAFWLLPQQNVFGGWPRSGEIDMMEYLGHETNKVYGTVHYGPGPGSTQISRNYVLPSGTFSSDFHVFALEWEADEIRWYVDGNLFSTVNKSAFGTLNYPFNEDFFIIINLAVGGNWPGNPDATTVFPQQLVVDYVRLYQ